MGSKCVFDGQLRVDFSVLAKKQKIRRGSLIKRKIENDWKQWVVDVRRELHAFPELSYEEKHTAAFIKKQLEQLGLPVQTFADNHAVIACIDGGLPGPVIALRADMDALPITEETELGFQSKQKGVMHACGHDGHMAMLLGAAYLLSAGENAFEGKIKLIFQPAEEMSPTGGAAMLLEKGVLEDVTAIFGLHVWPDIPTGVVAVKDGAMMGASDRVTIHLHGHGAHAGAPQKGVDAIVLAADVINGVGQLFSRQLDPLETATMNIGVIHGGERYNVVARDVTLEGTVRTLSPEVRQEIPKRLQRMLAGKVAAVGGTFDLDYRKGYPALHNYPEPTGIVKQATVELLGQDFLDSEILPTLASEDFARYLEKVPGAFFWIGCSAAGSEYVPLHNPKFTLDEDVLPIGAQLLKAIASEALRHYQVKLQSK